jgi:hypothetical protein
LALLAVVEAASGLADPDYVEISRLQNSVPQCVASGHQRPRFSRAAPAAKMIEEPPAVAELMGGEKNQDLTGESGF